MIGWTNDEARQRAKERYASDDIEIDEDAPVTHLEEFGAEQGGAWVQAWVYVPPREEELVSA